jgi:GNAT superfamily N-acetyltransferase
VQAGGIGRRMIAAAEAEAVARFGARIMEMTVIEARPDLIAWYGRRGYAPSGEKRPLPVQVGTSRAPLALVVLTRALRP